MMRGIASAAALAALAALTAVSCNESNKSVKTEAPPPAVFVTPVIKSKVTPVNEFVGQTKAQDTVDLVARVQGFLTKRNFVEGQLVKSGDLLFQIEKDEYAADVEQAQGALTAEQAKLEDAKITFARQETLWKQAAVAQKDYDNALYNKLAAEGNVAQADAKLKLAKLNLSYTDIPAPFDGCVGLSTYSPGNVVGPDSKKLATVVSIDPMRVEFTIDELDVLRFNIKASGIKTEERFPNSDQIAVKLKFQNDSVYPLEGKMSYADNHINISTGTLLVQAQFPNPGKVLIPGMYVKVLVSRKIEQETLLVSAKGVLENQAGNYVYVVGSDGVAVTKQIKIGARYGQLLAVESGLAEGDKVVTDGIQKIRPGAKVSATDDKAPAPSAEDGK